MQFRSVHAIALASTILLAACGGGGNGGSSPAVSNAPSGSGSNPAPHKNQKLLDGVRQAVEKASC